MALIECNYKSSALGMATRFMVILPEKKSVGKLRVLYLLHGLTDDCTAWQRYTSIERYLRFNSDTMVVMPAGGKSFYTDMAYGERYYTYVAEELPGYVNAMFNVSGKREDTYIAGLSMGGYGAVKIALAKPDKYFAAASFSGALDVAKIMQAGDDWKTQAVSILGEKTDIAGTKEDIYYLLDNLPENKPEILQMCGTEDFLYAHNQTFRQAAEKSGIRFEYREGPGDHNWDYWDECIKYALQFFEIENK